MTTSAPPVLIVGAGPTGLVLALGLARRGVAFRILDAAAGPGEHSRAMVVHARTLEFYRQLGIADDVVRAGIKVGAVHMREASEGGEPHELAHVSFADLGDSISPYPFALAYAQDDHERFLVDQLRRLGVEVEWNTRLTGFTQDDRGVQATLDHGPGSSRDGRTETATVRYLCGCDGVHSAVRETLGVGFPGGTYDQLYYVTDVKIAGAFQCDLFVTLGEHILALMLPVRSSGMQRLIGLVPRAMSERDDLRFDDIRSHIEPLLGIEVTTVNWFSTYRVHHRVAERFCANRAFLLGDAAHVHSPAGAQGMNTGIGDAINLAWKLAAVVQRRADASVLGTYETERIGFAKTLVSTTDRAFTPLVAEGVTGELTRRVMAPLFFSLLSRLDVTRHAFFRTLSQTRIHYPDSPLSDGDAGDVAGGDRLPWVGPNAPDNFAPLRSLDWQAHVYGEATPHVGPACAQLALPLHVFPWTDGARHAGFARDATYLVRPDGYVALAADEGEGSRLEAFAARFDLHFGHTPAARG